MGWKNTIDKSELDEVIKSYEAVSTEVKCLIVELKIKITKDRIEVISAIPTEVIQNEA